MSMPKPFEHPLFCSCDECLPLQMSENRVFPGEAVLASTANSDPSRKRPYDDIESDENKENQDPDTAMVKTGQEKRVRWTGIDTASLQGSGGGRSESSLVEDKQAVPLRTKDWKVWKITELEALLDAAESREKKYRETVAEKERLILDKNAALKQRGITISKVQGVSSSHRKTLAQKNTEIMSLLKRVSSLQGELNAITEKNLRFDKQVSELQAELELRRSKPSAFSSPTALQNKNTQLLHDLRHLDDELSQHEEHNRILRNENIQLRRDRCEAHKELHRLEQRSGILYSSYCWDSYRPTH